MQTNYTRAMAILSSANVAAAFAERRALANTIADAERELDVAAVVLKAVADRVSAATMGVKTASNYSCNSGPSAAGATALNLAAEAAAAAWAHRSWAAAEVAAGFKLAANAAHTASNYYCGAAASAYLAEAAAVEAAAAKFAAAVADADAALAAALGTAAPAAPAEAKAFVASAEPVGAPPRASPWARRRSALLNAAPELDAVSASSAARELELAAAALAAIARDLDLARRASDMTANYSYGSGGFLATSTAQMAADEAEAAAAAADAWGHRQWACALAAEHLEAAHRCAVAAANYNGSLACASAVAAAEAQARGFWAAELQFCAGCKGPAAVGAAAHRDWVLSQKLAPSAAEGMRMTVSIPFGKAASPMGKKMMAFDFDSSGSSRAVKASTAEDDDGSVFGFEGRFVEMA